MELKESKTKDILELAKEINANVEIQEFYVGRNSDSYFDSNNNIWDDIFENPDLVCFPIDYVEIIRDRYDYNNESTIDEMADVINNSKIINEIDEVFKEGERIVRCNDCYEVFGENKIIMNDDDEECCPKCNVEGCLMDLNKYDFNLSKLKSFPEKYDQIIKILGTLTDSDIDIYNDGYTIFDCEYIDEAIHEQTLDALGYWTVYFAPWYEDVEVAKKVGLLPFYYQDEFFLALGGCGMDLSPKLDAYVALTIEQIPVDSKFFSDPSYFKYVVGETIYNEIIKKCKRERKRYIISFEE